MNKLLVIGTSRGLGKAFAEYVDAAKKFENYTILTPSRSEIDLLNLEQVQTYIAENKPDIVVNFAVMNKDSFLHKTNLLNDQESLKCLQLGTVGQYNLVQSSLKTMRENKFGRIILFSSIVKERPVIGTSIYGCSKAFIEQLSKHVAKENASHNITCNTLQLGYCDVGLIERVDQKIIDSLNLPNNKLCSAEEVSRLIISVIENPYINGATIQMNGGM